MLHRLLSAENRGILLANLVLKCATTWLIGRFGLIAGIIVAGWRGVFLVV